MNYTMNLLSQTETDFNNWEMFFGKIYKTFPDSTIYMKGGSVIGLLVLKTIYNHSLSFDDVYFQFKNMNLIRDFDFILENIECCSDNFYYEFAKEYGIVLNGKKTENVAKEHPYMS